MNYKLKESLTLKKLKDNEFILRNNSIWYEMAYGVYLSFDFEDLKYIGVEMFFLMETEEIKEKEKQAIEKLKKLCLIEEY